MTFPIPPSSNTNTGTIISTQKNIGVVTAFTGISNVNVYTNNDYTNQDVVTVQGNGTGLKMSWTVSSPFATGEILISSVVITEPGSGYEVNDIVEIAVGAASGTPSLTQFQITEVKDVLECTLDANPTVTDFFGNVHPVDLTDNTLTFTGNDIFLTGTTSEHNNKIFFANTTEFENGLQKVQTSGTPNVDVSGTNQQIANYTPNPTFGGSVNLGSALAPVSFSFGTPGSNLSTDDTVVYEASDVVLNGLVNGATYTVTVPVPGSPEFFKLSRNGQDVTFDAVVVEGAHTLRKASTNTADVNNLVVGFPHVIASHNVDLTQNARVAFIELEAAGIGPVGDLHLAGSDRLYFGRCQLAAGYLALTLNTSDNIVGEYEFENYVKPREMIIRLYDEKGEPLKTMGTHNSFLLELEGVGSHAGC